MASSSSTPPPPSGETTYTAMDPPDTDLESIGAHCQFPYCHQLDFLPFRCDSCHGTYCLDHRSETTHKCAHAGEWARNRRKASVGTPTTSSDGKTLKPTVLTGQQCSEPKCKTLIHTFQHTGVHCQTCNRDYCLKHRFKEEHDCDHLVPLGARPAQQPQQSAHAQAKLAFSKLRSWGSAKTSALPSVSLPKPAPKPPSSRAAQAADLAALKRSAKGDPALPADRRVHLHVEAEAASTTSQTPKMDLYFDRNWTVGRLLDEAAKRMQVRNENNSTQGEEGRLRVFFVEGGRVLEFKEKVGECLSGGNTVVLLRGVGPGTS